LTKIAKSARCPREIGLKRSSGGDPGWCKHQISVDGNQIELSQGEILVQTQPLQGLAFAANQVITVAVDTVITPDLRAEGLAREIVRRVQDMRKNAGFSIEDRITTYYLGDSEDLDQVIANWAAYIKAETLATHLAAEEPSQEAFVEKHKLDGMELLLGVKRN